MSFIQGLVDSLAWPLVALIALLVLEEPLSKLILSLRRASYKGVSLEFSEKLETVERKADKLAHAVAADSLAPKEGALEKDFAEYIERLAEISPRAAIFEAWHDLEGNLKKAAEGASESESRNPRQLLKMLQSKGALSWEAASLVDDLRVLRNRAVHANDFELTREQAIEYGRLAERAAATLWPGRRSPVENNVTDDVE